MFRCLITFPLLFCVSQSAVLGQGLRVSTIVYDAGRLADNGQEEVLSSSFSLFNNGQVYDYVEAAGEVVIFNPIGKKFIVMNPDRGVFTSIAFAELNALLGERAPKTKEYLAELNKQKSREAVRAARMLEFQLNPKFATKSYPSSGGLVLTASSWKYEVSTREWNDEEQVARYLDYADWTARLNCILHPHSSFPEPRIALNDELRKLKTRIPVIVKLDKRPDERLVLRAEHQFVRNLTDRERSLITGWNDALKSTEMKQLPFRSYQERVLVSKR